MKFNIFSQAILKSSRNFSRDWRHSASVIPVSKKTVKSFFDDGSWNWEDTVAIVGELEGRPAVIFGADSKYPKLEEQVGLFNDQSLNDIGYFMFENYVHNDIVFSIPGARYFVLK